MDAHPRSSFADIVRIAQTIFESVVIETDTTPVRAILRIQAHYGPYRIFITELLDAKTRKYRYYVLQGDYIEAGFDNSPDPRALRMKYGHIGEAHVGEHIPHLHRANKSELSLTLEMHFTDFVEWLSQHLPLINSSS